ncbi:MAG: MBL fold metallo-hydrolase [Gammaproteobacteria bacterium]|nr:MBL fold metallo-hydrolase [Gammaproteobacteria bacterium]MXX94743.1 MBL fold metallo-hydrolase [Gammaproteobacteria bacterium]MYF54138.1 MBL fold metallo-hydrolase [Gammaproteobacteria bacterium]MYK43849.1 MBL fold metallo-hydrolase [Gammaproteobacteria bacterium]
MLRFTSLGSGSRGNSTLISSKQCKVLVDCGFSVKETEKRLLTKGIEPEAIDAIFVTHEHGDHGNGVGRFGRRYNVPIYGTAGTLNSIDTKNCNTIDLTRDEYLEFGDLNVLPISVPHDAREPSQYIFEHAEKRFGILTDLGHITEHVVAHYKTCHALLLEANHDLGQLWNGSYPESLKQRIAGDNGHLSNCQSMELLDRLDAHSLNSVVLAHLSDENNCPNVVNEQFERFRTSFSIQLASQELGSEWIEV